MILKVVGWGFSTVDKFEPFEFMAFYCPVCQEEMPARSIPNNGYASCPKGHMYPVGRTIVVYHEYGIIKQDLITGVIVNERTTVSKGSSSATWPD